MGLSVLQLQGGFWRACDGCTIIGCIYGVVDFGHEVWGQWFSVWTVVQRFFFFGGGGAGWGA